MNKLILNRIQPQLDPLFRNNQNGFRPKKNTTAHILALRRIIEEAKRNNVPATIVFVDFSKAFDSIHRAKMMQILKAYGIPNELVNAIQKLYEETRAKVLSFDGETEYFEILGGVFQGDTLAPYLFTIVIDYIMRMAIDGKEELGFILNPKRSRRYSAEVITELDYADDTPSCHEIAEAKKLLNRMNPKLQKMDYTAMPKKPK